MNYFFNQQLRDIYIPYFRAHIGRLGMDGSDRRDLVTRDIGWPNALAVDYVLDHIYWADARLDYIKIADLDGSRQRVVLKGNLPHVFALTVFGSELFWTDWEHKSVDKAHKFSGRDKTTIRRFIHRPMDIHIVHPSRQLQCEWLIFHLNSCTLNFLYNCAGPIIISE